MCNILGVQIIIHFLQATLKPEWREIHNLSRVPGLHDIAFGVMDILKKSKLNATNRKYDIYFNKFKSWCLQFKLSHLVCLTFYSFYVFD